MKDLFEFIKAKINASIPELKTVAVWNNQTSRERDTKTEGVIKFPAVFIEFLTDEGVQNLSLGIKRVPLRVRCRFAIEGYRFQRLEDFELQKKFDSFIQNFRGNPDDVVQFSTLQEMANDLDEAHDQVNEPFIDYSTMWTKNSAYQRKTDITKTPITSTVTGEQMD